MIKHNARWRHRWRMLMAQFRMRAEANELQRVVVGLAVDQDQVGLDMAIPVITPIPGQRVVTVAHFRCFIIRQEVQNWHQVGIERCPVLTFGFSFVVAVELPGWLCGGLI